MATEPAAKKAPNRQDFVSGAEVRWCPGCGDYSILAQTQKVMAEIGIARERHVFVSGIGCSSRFPYYMATYGIHSIHGRAPTLATGLKCARPDLVVWIVTGDGDALSIGGNHLIHTMRRNVDVKILLFNHRIYGLTKGQYSPTSEKGKKTKSSPLGTIDYPFRALSVAIAAEATFVARTVDRYTQHLQDTLRAAYEHRGTAFVEILQNCPIFNDGAHAYATESDMKGENVVLLSEGKPLVYGNEKDKGIRMAGTVLEKVDLARDPEARSTLIVHDSARSDPTVAFLLSRLDHPDHPLPIGVLRRVARPTYDGMLLAQVETARRGRTPDLAALLAGTETWTVDGA
ncbi:MAG: 2-oxoacid:ferredoxin oxidoreductase subunit beta [Planctomycetes bacterium]|nr:2-oxoacid:ferredoxin oxidoreductase subunit beta [Planctomycetota bacterium]